MTDVSILIVSYNTREMTLDAIRSARRETTRVSAEIIVVDNASADGSPDAIAGAFPEVRLIRLEDNVGFAAGNNAAAEHATGDYNLLLNPDTLTLDHAIDNLVEFARAHPRNRIYGGRTLTPERALDPTSVHGLPSLWAMFARGIGVAALCKRSEFFNPESLGTWQRDTVREVPIVCGCLLLIERDLWETLDGFDEQFHMYAEEFDLCMRARERGARPICCPAAEIIHIGGASDRVLADQTVRQYRARMQLLDKHWPRWKAALAARCLDLWAFNKLLRSRLLSLRNHQHRELAATWSAILSRRREWRPSR